MNQSISTIDAVAIVSGGLDSVTLLHYLCRQKQLRTAVLTFTYGQKHAQEIECAQFHATLLNCPDHQLIDLSSMASLFSSSALVAAELPIPDILHTMGDPQPTTYVPNRNMIFLSLAAAYAESRQIPTIYYGAQKHDLYGYWDTTPDFLKRINDILSLNRKNQLTIQAPFVNYSKGDIVRIGLELEIDYSQTWSCYNGGDAACGRCPTCAERLAAFAENNSNDPLPYLTK